MRSFNLLAVSALALFAASSAIAQQPPATPAVAELQGHGGRRQPRRVAQRQQQARLRQLAVRTRLHHPGSGFAPNRHDVLTGSTPEGNAFPAGTIAPAATGPAARRAPRWSGTSTRRGYATTCRRARGIHRTPRAVLRAAAARPTCAAPAAMDCSTASRRTRRTTTSRLPRRPNQPPRSFFASITWMPLLPLTTCVTRRSAVRLHSV